VADKKEKVQVFPPEKPPKKPLTKESIERALEKVQKNLDEEYMEELSGKKEQEARRRERVALRREAISKFGEGLGEAYFNYAWGDPATDQERGRQRAEFAQAIVSAFETETHGDKVKAITALLDVFEVKIGPVAEKAERADFRDRPIGIGD